MSKLVTYFADTTIVYYKIHGHTLLRQETSGIVKDGRLSTSYFVKGEYIRGYIIGLIELFSVIREENSVKEGVQLFIADNGRNPRKIANALESTTEWLVGQEESADIDITLRRLGEYIRGCLIKFDLFFPNRSRDPIDCEIGILSFRQETYDEKHVLDFAEDFAKVVKAPGCSQCAFRASQTQQLATEGIDLHSPTQQAAYAQYKGYVTQAKNAGMAVRSPKKQPTCWYCDRLGDTVIALSAPDGTTILTGDKQSFPALAAILKKPLVLLPSLQELRERHRTKEA